MSSHAEVIAKFSKGATKGKGSNVFINGDVLYSYGTHFPLLVRMPWGLLQNADKYSVSTAKHQRLASRVADILIPFSALSNAGIYKGQYYIEELIETFKFIDKSKDVYEKRSYVNKDGETIEYDERRPSACVFKANGKYYISSMDNSNYFISQLPRKAKSVQDAFNMLLPKECKGKRYERQGEFFFIPSSLTTKDIPFIVKQARLKNKREGQAPHHYVTEAGFTLNGKVYARGTVRHSQGDHTMLKLGNVWHEVIESNHTASFGAAGNVD